MTFGKKATVRVDNTPADFCQACGSRIDVCDCCGEPNPAMAKIEKLQAGLTLAIDLGVELGMSEMEVDAIKLRAGIDQNSEVLTDFDVWWADQSTGNLDAKLRCSRQWLEAEHAGLDCSQITKLMDNVWSEEFANAERAMKQPGERK